MERAPGGGGGPSAATESALPTTGVDASNRSGIDPASGQILWQIPWFTRYGVNAASPIVTDKRVFVSSGYSKGAALYEVQGTEADLIWKNRKYRNQINSSVLVDGHLYGFDGDNNSRAKFKCVAFETGKDLWETEEVSFGSLIGAGDLLLILSEEGNLLTLRPSPEKFEVLHQSKILDGRCWATPVLANGRLYARNADGKLVCLDARAGR